MTRKFIIIMAILFLTGLFNTASAKEKPFEGTTLTALLEDHPTVKVIAKLLPEFEEATGINVNIEVLPFEKMTKKFLETCSAKSPKYDVYMDGWVHAIEMAAANRLEPLEGYTRNSRTGAYVDLNDFVPAYLNDARYRNKLYGLPVYGESTFLYFRKDVFEKLGLSAPSTMNDLLDAARKIKASKTGLYPVTLRGRKGIHAVYAWASFLWAFGGCWIDENGKAALDSPEAIASVKFYSMLLNDYGPPGFSNFGWMENRDVFMKGKAAISIDATVNGAYNEDAKISKVAGKTGYAITPVAAGVKLKGGQCSLITHQLYLNKYGRNKDAAFVFISWATSKQVQMKGLEIEPDCGITSRTVLKSNLYQKKYGTFEGSMMEALNNGNPKYIPTIPEGPAIFEKTGEALSRVLSGKETAESAMTRVNRDINENILKRHK